MNRTTTGLPPAAGRCAAHPCLSLLSPQALRAIGIGALTGAVTGLVGGLFPAGAGLAASMLWGAAGGAAASVTGVAVTNALCGRATTLEEVLAAGISGMISGAFGGALGWGIRSAAQSMLGTLAGGACPGGVCKLPGECFVAGTLIATADGERPIEEIKVGDKVYATDPDTGETGLFTVTDAFTRTAEATVVIEIGSAHIRATLNHPFWVEGTGWTDAGHLPVGDCVPCNG